MIVDSLSKRGQTAYKTPTRIDAQISQQARTNLFHPTENPNGAFVLNVAENRLNWSMLKAKFEDISQTKHIPDWVPIYSPNNGAPSALHSIARFLQTAFNTAKINPDHIALSSGAAGVIEVASCLTADSNDVAVIPAPAYPVYTQDLGKFGGIIRYDLIPETAKLSISDLNRAQRELTQQGKNFRLLILTSPNNPDGQIYSQEQYREIANWCIANQIHLFTNEIYGLSQINTSHPAIADDYKNAQAFFSFANIVAEYKNPYLHFWYAFSKDFGLSGFRVGVLYSENLALMQAYSNVNATHGVSNHTQWLLQQLLDDSEFVENYIEANQKSLTKSYIAVTQFLKQQQISYTPSYGNLFVWADFSDYLSAQSDEAELVFWKDLYDQTQVLLTPGVSFGHSQRGLLRLVFSAIDYDSLQIVFKRLGDYLEKKRNHKIGTQ